MATKKTTPQKPIKETKVQSAPIEAKEAVITASKPIAVKNAAPSSYASTQCIGFEIVTSPLGDTYVGIDNIAKDIEERCNLMWDAINLAATQKQVDHSSKTLKIFMAPEFYFRGPKGAYDISVVSMITANLQAKVADKKWEDWLFIFGTIITYSKPSTKDPFYQLVSSSTGTPIGELNETYNYAFIQRGGSGKSPTTTEANSRIVMKEFLSGIDFVELSADGMDMLNSEYMPPLAPPSVGQEQQIYNYDGLSVYEMAGFTIGTEICLDHGEERLINSPQAPGQNYLQMQMIPSCGMSIVESSVAVITGGIIFNVDGLYRGKQRGKSALSINGLTPNPLPVTVDLDPSEFTPVVAVDKIFGYGPGRVAIYPKTNIPPTQVVPGAILTYEYKEEPFNLTLQVYYDGAGKFIAAFLSGKVSNYELQLLREKLPITGGSYGSDIKLSARTIQGTFGSCDMAVYIDFECGDDHIVGPIFPFSFSVSLAKKD